jgi:hypothetical protein
LARHIQTVSLFRDYPGTLSDRERSGALEDSRDSIKWDMIYHIVVVTPKNRKSYANMFYDIDLPKVHPASIKLPRRATFSQLRLRKA